jgi:FtsZ-binding cell division protein ZapB
MGNLDLDASTATTGNITKNGVRFLHNFGTSNTFLGVAAGNMTMTGSGNTATGSDALQRNTTGVENTANGANALGNNTTVVGNTANGHSALGNNTTGGDNTASGSFALFRNTTGNNNVAVGGSAGFNGTTGSNNIYLGAFGVAGESNTMYLGRQGTQTTTFIAGIRGTTTVNPDAIPVMIDSAGQLGTVSSSRRFKEDILDMADTSRRLFQLRPVTFRYTQAYRDGSKPIQYGLIAEEVAEAFPELAVRNAGGAVETVHYETLNVLLLNELQKQQHELQTQQDELKAERHARQEEQQRQQQRIEALERRLNDLLDVRETSTVTRGR